MRHLITSPYSHYQLLYAKRHRIPVHIISETPKLDLAAFLEYQVKEFVLTLPDARRRYIEEYPESNHLPVPKTVINVKENTYYNDTRYALTSVLNLIQPYPDSIREVRNLI